MGATIGTAVFLSVLFSTVGNNIAKALQQASTTPAFRAALADPSVQSAPGNQRLLAILRTPGSAGGSGTINDTSFLNGADKRLAHPFFVGFSTSMDLVFLIAAGVLVVALVVMTLLRELPLRTTSGIEAATAERAAQAAQGGAALGPAGDVPVGVTSSDAAPEPPGRPTGG
jgi:hypothetical protein